MANLTEKAIKQAFMKLLEQRPIGRITVKDIAAECGINRNTFYYHFQDIPSLLMGIVKEDIDRIIQSYPSIESLEECVDVASDFAKQNKRAVLHIYHSVNRDVYEQYIWQICEYTVTTYFDTAFRDRRLDPADRRMIIRYIKCEIFGQLNDWLQNDMSEEVAASLRKMLILKKGQAEEIIGRCEKDWKARQKYIDREI